MPSSRYNVIPFVLDVVTYLQPRSILDIGIGFGKYGVLFREYLDIWQTDKPYNSRTVRLDGVEAFLEYENPVWQVYDKVYKDNVMNILPELSKTKYDLIFMGDVIEHFNKSEGEILLSQLNYEHIILVTPLQVLEQDAVYNNTFEQHKSGWTSHDFPALKSKIIMNQQVFYG